MHQDAHEFLNYLLNTIAEDVHKHQAETQKEGDVQETWVHQLFEGVFSNESKCLTCETVTSRDEKFMDLSIDVEMNSSVTSCLRQFSASEILCHKNKYYCDVCCGLQEAERRMKLKKLPNVLALHLKRFKYQEHLQKYIKLTYRVVFPFELRLFNTCDETDDADRLYELWAVVVHLGSGPHHGHYITLIKHSGQWLLFDDDVVTSIGEDDIQQYFGDLPGGGSGYVLFYQAVNIDMGSLNVDIRKNDLVYSSSVHGGRPPVTRPQKHGLPPPIATTLDLNIPTQQKKALPFASAPTLPSSPQKGAATASGLLAGGSMNTPPPPSETKRHRWSIKRIREKHVTTK
ncbi:hypothetical protein BX666DRAFT_1944226 [Dichotomocladium elegans]|nr:hypothetical protein BX666DRAFT_1944226 [Dichotomocladium elegans]